jgi:NADH:ubiquinone oxidoreductase subunit F (NADH-binding)
MLFKNTWLLAVFKHLNGFRTQNGMCTQMASALKCSPCTNGFRTQVALMKQIRQGNANEHS